MAQEKARLLTMPVASADVINKNRFVKVSGTGTAEECDTAGEDAIGISVDSSAANATRAIAIVDLNAGGYAEVEAGGAISAGARVETDADGKAVTAAGANSRVLGTAREAAAAEGEIVEIYVGSRGFTTN